GLFMSAAIFWVSSRATSAARSRGTPLAVSNLKLVAAHAATLRSLAAIGVLRLRARPTRTITPTSAKAALVGDPENQRLGNSLRALAWASMPLSALDTAVVVI